MPRTDDDFRTTSPFENVPAVMATEVERDRGRTKWMAVAILAVFAACIGVGLVWSTVSDPLRTMPVFPVEKYFASPNALSGASFKADLRVDGDLGWQAGVGRLMTFSFMNEPEQNHLAVLIPSRIADTVFDKNQAYRVELTVDQGGLIRAKSLKKL